ncbi:hypothetical protein SASPL_120710 [Salvia splendens]|uniref:MYB-related transcription factor LHY n=1 Tax=Salvia splendens TaxID=180675 RepID=A0A8X8XQL1_SALSN|nr:hypothetical protein SASPL_120710 [Salvia splendens]
MDDLEAADPALDDPGYLSDGFVHQHGSHKRKRGNPWSEEEHRSFLKGLEKLGRGNWKGIATEFVPSRKSSQVASHAQKYFNRLKLTISNKKRRRASVFDMASISAAVSKDIREHKEMPHVKRPQPVQPYSWRPDLQVIPPLMQHPLGEVAEVAGKKVLELDPDDDVVYELLFSINDNIYRSKNR